MSRLLVDTGVISASVSRQRREHLENQCSQHGRPADLPRLSDRRRAAIRSSRCRLGRGHAEGTNNGRLLARVDQRAVTTHIVVLGLMGAGKSSIGRRIADRLGRALIDGDEQLEARAGRTASAVAQSDGIDALHLLETDLLHEALAITVPSVIAPAASVIDDDGCLDALRAHAVVWLSAPAALLAATASDKPHRPLVGSDDDVDLFARQVATREPRIRTIAALVIDVATIDEEAAADQIVSLVGPPSSSSPS